MKGSSTLDRHALLLYSLLMASLVWTLGGCSWTSSDEPALRLKTDQKTYKFGVAKTIQVTVENQSLSTVHFNGCMPTTLEAMEADQAIGEFSFPVCECLCYGELKPLERWEHRVFLDEIKLMHDRPRLGEGRQFRLRLLFYGDSKMRHLLEEESLYTNQFEITE